MSTVATLDFKYRAADPSDYFDDRGVDNKLYAADVADCRFAVFIPATASDTWPSTKGTLRTVSAFCAIGRVWAIENFDIRSKPDLSLDYVATGIVNKGALVTNPQHRMMHMLNELPTLAGSVGVAA